MFLHTVKVCTNLKFWRLWHCCRCWSWRASGSHWEGGGHKGHCTQVEVQPESALNKCIEQEEEDKRSSCERGFRLAFPFSNTPLSPTPIFVFNLRCCLYVFSPVPRLPSLCLPCAFPFLHICQISHIVSLSQQNTYPLCKSLSGKMRFNRSSLLYIHSVGRLVGCHIVSPLILPP